jgi:hypothetical protein
MDDFEILPVDAEPTSNTNTVVEKNIATHSEIDLAIETIIHNNPVEL